MTLLLTLIRRTCPWNLARISDGWIRVKVAERLNDKLAARVQFRTTIRVLSVALNWSLQFSRSATLIGGTDAVIPHKVVP